MIPGLSIFSVTVGDTCFFGHYPQDDNSAKCSPIEWLVLSKESGKMLLVSKYALDSRPFSYALDYASWENSALRSWLNQTFLSKAFDGVECESVLTAKVHADDNPKYCFSNPGSETEDKVFLLSASEADQYFHSDEERKCVPTKYAVAQGADIRDAATTTEGEPTCRWWLRTPGFDCSYTVGVFDYGMIYLSGIRNNSTAVAVRPALWVKYK